VIEPASELPPALRAFLHSCIESVDQVETLMLLRGSDRFRTAREVADALGVSTPTTRRNLETLAARGLLEVSVGAETVSMPAELRGARALR
jgi:predicted ArsR family transcriptional regulator